MQKENSIPVQAASWIVKTPGVCGGDARIAGTRIPVWIVEKARRGGAGVREILEDYPSLSDESVLAAFSYASLNLDEIERNIRDQEG